ncbi:MAG: 3'-5' exonuclease [Bifidobacteriaceae bacterium]|jgi:DNA polymerase-3 subunit epsilon|nr:3'-5' exonuclease [Bifidobacteriaceae bacterium]
MAGFAVIAVGTTGFLPEAGDRIVEVATVHLDPAGDAESCWDTLVNPGRGVGPSSIHGLTDADVVEAPTFPEVAGTVVAGLAGRVFTAHNPSLDRRFLLAEFELAGWNVPLASVATLSTMAESRAMWPGAPRRLSALCHMRGFAVHGGRTALGNALAVAQVVRHLLRAASTRAHGVASLPWDSHLAEAARQPWPNIPIEACPRISRGEHLDLDTPVPAAV